MAVGQVQLALVPKQLPEAYLAVNHKRGCASFLAVFAGNGGKRGKNSLQPNAPQTKNMQFIKCYAPC